MDAQGWPFVNIENDWVSPINNQIVGNSIWYVGTCDGAIGQSGQGNSPPNGTSGGTMTVRDNLGFWDQFSCGAIWLCNAGTCTADHNMKTNSNPFVGTAPVIFD